MNFYEWLKIRANTRCDEVVVVTEYKMRPNRVGVYVRVAVQHTELKKPEYHDAKSLFVQTLNIKLKDLLSNSVSTWDSFLGWLQRWKASSKTILIGKALWKQYTRSMRNLRIRDSYAPRYG